MKILVASEYYQPDDVGIPIYTTDFAAYLAEKNHEVTVVTGFPFYPAWKKRQADNGVLFRKEWIGRIKCLRGYLYVPTTPKILGRIISEITFVIFAFFNFLRAGKHKHIVIVTPPASLGLLGVLFKKIWSAKLIIHIQDLQSDAAISLGMVKKTALAPRVLKWIEDYTNRKADLIIVISQGMRDQLIQAGAPADKIKVHYNWIDVKKASAPREPDVFCNEISELKGKFIVGYAGNIGVKQGLKVMLELAKLTQDISNIHYLIVGDGAQRNALHTHMLKNELKNVTMLPFMGKDKYADMLSATDIAFLSQQTGTGNAFFPSKLLSILAQSRPLLVSADDDSETAQVVKAFKLGEVVPYGDADSLRGSLMRLYNDQEMRKQAGANGLEWVKKNDRETVLSKFCRQIETL